MTGLEPLLIGAAAAGKTAATAGLFGTAGAFSLGTTLGTLGTLAGGLSALSSIQGARGQASIAKANAQLEAAQYEHRADMEALRAQQEETNRQKRLSQLLSSQAAGAAGRGYSLSSGSFLAISDESISEVDRESKIAAFDSGTQRSLLRAQARQSYASGSARASSFRAQAVGSLLDFGQQTFNRMQTT